MYEVRLVNKCNECGEPTKNKSFCSRNCSAKYNNSKRIRSDESKNKTSKSLKKNISLEMIQAIGLNNTKTFIAKQLNCSRAVITRVLKDNNVTLIVNPDKVPNQERYCTKHQEEYSTYSSGHKYVCKKCCTERVSERRRELKRLAVEYKGGKCEDCGYCKSVSALEFHHVDPSQKDFAIGTIGSRSFEKLKVELDKCKMLCANCHREEHDRLGYDNS